jgi:hypothetical protein
MSQPVLLAGPEIRKQVMDSHRTPALPKVPQSVRGGRKIKVFNLSDNYWPVSLGELGTFFIPPCEPGQPHSRALEIDENFVQYWKSDLKKYSYEIHSGLDIAKEVIGINGGSGSDDKSKWGVFIAAGDAPTKEELAAARAKLTQKMKDLVRQADAFQAAGPLQYENIGDWHRKACLYLNETRPWNNDPKENVAPVLCEACMQPYPPGAAVHAVENCGHVLDEAKVKKFKLKGYEHIWQEEPKSRRQKED